MTKNNWIEEKMAELNSEQAGKSQADIEALLSSKRDESGNKVYEHVFNPDTAQPQAHNFIDRGLIISCEGAGHPWHQMSKRR